MKRILGLVGLLSVLATAGYLMAAETPIIDDSNPSHRGYESMSREQCVRCHKMGLKDAPKAPGHCIKQDECISCHG